jgi:hypothetical protein
MRVRTVEVTLPQYVLVAVGAAECERQQRVQAGLGEGELQQSAGGGGAEREECGCTQQLHGYEVAAAAVQSLHGTAPADRSG